MLPVIPTLNSEEPKLPHNGLGLNSFKYPFFPRAVCSLSTTRKTY